MTLKRVLWEKRIYILGLVGMLITTLPMILWKDFYLDWFRNTWLIEYYREYFKNHFGFPEVINTFGEGKYQNYVGMMHPSYYGVWFYRIEGIFCALLGGGARRAIFLTASICSFVQWIVWFRLIKRITGKQSTAAFISLINQISIYGLTNLYCRNAVPEFFACIALSITVGLWLNSLITNNMNERICCWICCGFFLSLMMGTHPITTLLGGIFLVFLFLSTVWKVLKDWKWQYLLCGGMVLLLVLLNAAPWLYSVLNYNVSVMAGGKIKYSEGIDELILRLFPIPRCTASFESVLTWHLDAQANVYLLLLWIFLLAVIFIKKSIHIKQKICAGIVWAIGAGLLLVSAIPELGNFLPDFLGIIQFAYRLVTYCDLIALVGIVQCLCILNREKIVIAELWIIVWTLLAAAGMSYLVKLVNISEIGDQYDYDSKTYVELTDAFYNPDDYMDSSEWNVISEEKVESAKKISFPVNEGKSFGETELINLSMDEDGWAGINVYPHGENNLYINGIKLSHDKMYLTGDRNWSYVYLEKGNYTLEYQYEETLVKEVLDILSGISMFLLCVGSLGAGITYGINVRRKDKKGRLASGK